MDILEIQLLTDDISGTESFYGDLLGLSVISKNDGSISFSAGTSILTFILSHKLKPFYHFAFNIPSNKIAEAFAWMNLKTEILQVSPTDKIADFLSWNAKAFYFYDNNGNILELIARFDLKNQTDEPISSSCLLCISEIGWVADNTESRAAQILKENSFSYFAKQTPRNDFVVVGDDHGLLIFVENRRNWFPTSKPAEKHWAKIRISDKGRVTDLTMGQMG